MRKAIIAALAALTVGGALASAAPADARPCGFWRHGNFHRTACRRVVVVARPAVVVRPGVVVAHPVYVRRAHCGHRRWDPYLHRRVWVRGRCWR